MALASCDLRSKPTKVQDLEWENATCINGDIKSDRHFEFASQTILVVILELLLIEQNQSCEFEPNSIR